MYNITQKQINDAADKTTEFMEKRKTWPNYKSQKRAHFYGCLEQAINNIFGYDTLKGKDFGRAKHLVSKELWRRKNDKKAQFHCSRGAKKRIFVKSAKELGPLRPRQLSWKHDRKGNMIVNY